MSIVIINPNHRLLDEEYMPQSKTAKLIINKRLRNTVIFVRRALEGATDPFTQPAWHHNFRTMKRIINVPRMNEGILHAALLCNIPKELDLPISMFYQCGYPWTTLNILDTINQQRLREDRGKNFLEWIIWISKYGSVGSRIVKLAELYDWISQAKKWDLEDIEYIQEFAAAIVILENTIPDKALEAITKD